MEDKPSDRQSGRFGDEPDRGDHPAADDRRREESHDASPDTVGQPAANDLARDVGECLEPSAAAAVSARIPPRTAPGTNAWSTPSSKTPIAAAPAKRIQNRLVRTVRRTLWRWSPLPLGGISRAADTAPGAAVSWSPAARAASFDSAARRLSWPALSGSPIAARERAGTGADGLGRFAPGAGTTIEGPLVITQTKATPTRHEAMKTSDAGRQPTVWISCAAIGSATATPIPGPA